MCINYIIIIIILDSDPVCETSCTGYEKQMDSFRLWCNVNYTGYRMPQMIWRVNSDGRMEEIEIVIKTTIINATNIQLSSYIEVVAWSNYDEENNYSCTTFFNRESLPKWFYFDFRVRNHHIPDYTNTWTWTTQQFKMLTRACKPIIV